VTRKILILTPVTPDTQSASGRFVQHLLQDLGPESAAIALITDKSGTIPEQFETLRISIPPAPVLKRSNFRFQYIVERIYWLFRQSMLKRLADLTPRITSFAARNHVFHMIAILDHPATIWLTKRIAHAMGIGYSTYSSTVPQCVLLDAGYDTWSRAQIYKTYVEIQKSSQAAGFATGALKKYHRDEFSLNAMQICIPAKVASLANSERRTTPSPKKILIGTILNLRFISSTQALITACQEIGWQLNGKQIALRAIGSAAYIPFQFKGKPADIEILGGQTEDEIADALAECSFNFLPFWMETHLTQAAQLCLPDDFPVYIAAARPILVHSLKSSFVEALVEEFSLGVAVQECNKTVLIEAMTRLAKGEDNAAIKGNFSRLHSELCEVSQPSAGIQHLLPFRL